MSRIQRVLTAIVPIRIGLDLVGFVPVGRLNLAELGSAGIAVVLAVVVALRWRAALTHPWRAPMAAFVLCLGIGAVRASTAFDAARYGLHLGMPVLWLLALHAGWDPRADLPRSWVVAAAVPIVLSLGALAAGQPAEHVLHGWPRLWGPYANLHSHAAVMAVFAATFLVLASLRRSAIHTALGVGAAICVAATWVRTAWLWVALASVLAVLARRRVGVALIGVGLAVAAIGGLTVLRERWSDVIAVLTLTPPADGWGALGSWRVRIWTESFAGYLAGPRWDVLLGRGLGGQYGLHRNLDPHSEWLALLYQLGPLGLLVWFGWMGTALVDLGRRAVHDDRSLIAFAVLGGAVATSVISNDWLVRATPVVWTFGLVGHALRARVAGVPSRRSTGGPAGPAADGTGATAAPRAE